MTARPVRFLLRTVERRSGTTVATVVAVLLAACWAISQHVGGSVSVSRHLFYLPIIVAATRFGPRGGVVAGLLATVLGGPAAAADGAAGVWLGRGVAFLGVGIIVGTVVAERDVGLARQREVAERESRLATRSAAIVQLVSHEFRTPLTVIRGGIATLRDREGAVDPSYCDLVKAIDRACVRLDGLLAGVLAAADRLDTDPLEQTPHDLTGLLERVRASVPAGQRDRVRVVVPAGAQMVTVESHLQLLLRLLVENGLKFGPAGGGVLVDVTLEPRAVNFRVSDEGPGIPVALGEQALEPFTQGDPSESRVHPGLGMGLFTARQLARRLGGELRLERTDGDGCRPVVTLPQRREADRRGRPRRPAPSGSAR